MPTITTESKKVDRTIELDLPEILLADSLANLVTLQGEELCIKQVKAQLTIAFRSKVRGLLESTTDDELTNSDEDIAEMDFSDWKPEARTRKTAEEKAMDMLGGMTPEQRAAILANFAD